MTIPLIRIMNMQIQYMFVTKIVIYYGKVHNNENIGILIDKRLISSCLPLTINNIIYSNKRRIDIISNANNLIREIY